MKRNTYAPLELTGGHKFAYRMGDIKGGSPCCIGQNIVQYNHGGGMMITVDYANARDNFKRFCDMAVHDFETIIVTRKQDENAVVMSETQYNNLMENLYIRSDKVDYQYLRTIQFI